MEKIVFENLPSMNTPISAENLNAIQDNTESAINSVVNILSIGTVTGQITIGNIGIEWGTVSVAPTSGSNPYYGSVEVTFLNTYQYNPMMIACLGAGYTSVTNVATTSVSNTSGNVWMNATSQTARTCRYLVIGLLNTETNEETQNTENSLEGE